MEKRRFHCRRCDHKFEKYVLEPGEAEDKNLPSGAVRCPECGSTDVERR